MNMVSKPNQTIIFDFGGVVVNWDPRRVFGKYFNNDREAIDNFLKEINFHQWNLAQDKGYPFKKAVLDLSDKFPQYTHLIRAYDEEWEQSIAGIIPETARIIYRLKARGIRIYGLTNWSAEKFSLVRRKISIFDQFEGILVSGEVGLIKPDPAIYHLFLKRYNLIPEECLLVDDSPVNIKTAREIGLDTHLFTSPLQLEFYLQQLGIL